MAIELDLLVPKLGVSAKLPPDRVEALDAGIDGFVGAFVGAGLVGGISVVSMDGCSGVEWVMRCSLNENYTVRTFFGFMATNPFSQDYHLGHFQLLWHPR